MQNQGEFVAVIRHIFDKTPLCFLQHIFYKNAVTFCRILYEYMRYRPDQLPILYDGTAAHSLDNPACLVQKCLIRHLDDKSFVDLLFRSVDICHQYVIFLYFSVNKATYRSRSFRDFFFGRSLNWDLFFK